MTKADDGFIEENSQSWIYLMNENLTNQDLYDCYQGDDGFYCQQSGIPRHQVLCAGAWSSQLRSPESFDRNLLTLRCRT